MLEQENYESIQIDKRENGVTVATLNRPEKLNAVDGRLHYELTTLWPDANADAEVKVLVVTGAGRAFCSGGDFSADRKPGPGGPGAMMREARLIVDNLLDCEKPVISAVRGYAMGLGPPSRCYATWWSPGAVRPSRIPTCRWASALATAVR